MEIIDGRKLAAEIRLNLKTKILNLDTPPGLAVLLVGNNPASHLYVRLKAKACLEAGINFEKFIFEETAEEKSILDKINELNGRTDIHGILVQVPLPEKFDTDKIISTIDPGKDVDGFHPANLAALREKKPKIIPGVALGIMKLIESTNISLKDKKAALLIKSDIFAVPIEYLLKRAGMSVDIFNFQFLISNFQSNLKSQISNYDIIIIAVGKPGFLKSEKVKNGAIIIDVGTTVVDGKTIGDADFASFKNKKGWITPVPGGVGPMTVAGLVQNIYNLRVKK